MIKEQTISVVTDQISNPTYLQQFVKSIYSNYLPQVITTKPKTGWTVPIRDWLKLKNINEDDTSASFVNTVATKGNKARIPAWILHSWIKRYNIII